MAGDRLETPHQVGAERRGDERRGPGPVAPGVERLTGSPPQHAAGRAVRPFTPRGTAWRHANTTIKERRHAECH
jgi:hypothetical protein